MDGSRFDGLVRTLATGQTRRRALQSLGGGSLASLLGLAGLEDAAAACVKPGKKGCDGPKNKQCCDGARCQGGTNTKEGRCKCKGNLKQCDGKCVNTNKDDKHRGMCNKKCRGSNMCEKGKCISKLGCKAGEGRDLCQTGQLTLCPGRKRTARRAIAKATPTHGPKTRTTWASVVPGAAKYSSRES